jgi:hypothetical protein
METVGGRMWERRDKEGRESGRKWERETVVGGQKVGGKR